MSKELGKKWGEIICRQCDGISHADTCDLKKEDCPVLKTMPGQLLKIVNEEFLTWLEEHGNQAQVELFKKEKGL